MEFLLLLLVLFCAVRIAAGVKGRYLRLLTAGAGVTQRMECVGDVKTERVS